MSPRGDGSVVKVTLPSGATRYKARLVIAGKRVEKTGRSKSEAIDLLRALRSARERGLTDAGRSPTVETWLYYWLAEIAPQRCAESTLSRYRAAITTWIVPTVGAVRLDRLTPEHIRTVYRVQREAGRAGSTIYQSHAVLRRALRVAQAEGKVMRNVAALVDGPSTAHAEIVPITRSDARRLLRLAEAQGTVRGVRWVLALALGMRQGEVLGLAWSDIDLESRRIEVRWQLQRHRPRHGCAPARPTDDWPCRRKQAARCPDRIGDAGLFLKPPKSSKSRRTLFLPEQLVTALRAHRSKQASERLGHSNWLGSGLEVDLVFTRTNGRPIDPRQDRADWDTLMTKAGVAPARLHDARHTAATVLLEMGVDVKVVSEMLGHSTPYFTQAQYQHVMPELATAAADSMAEALWGEERVPAPRDSKAGRGRRKGAS